MGVIKNVLDCDPEYKPRFKKGNTIRFLKDEETTKIFEIILSSRQGDGVYIPVYLMDNNKAYYCEINDEYFKGIE